jgi:hypothetical protein
MHARITKARVRWGRCRRLCSRRLLSALTSQLCRLRRRYGTPIVTSWLGGNRVHFAMDPHDIALFSKEPMDR